MNRREFLRAGMVGGLVISISPQASAFFNNVSAKTRVGIITDLHHDLMPDSSARLDVFLNEMKSTRPHAIMQMGDFAVPKDSNAEIYERFNSAHKHCLHVLGNHDTDGGHTVKQVTDLWRRSTPYYSYNVNGIEFVVLNGNEKGSPKHKGGYPSYIGETQFAWLKARLESSNSPVIIVCHQPLAGAMAVDNAEDVQKLLTTYKHKVLMAINGHSHINSLLTVGGINYLHINSASYFWLGDKYSHPTYSEEIAQRYPYVRMFCPYKDALYTTMIIDPEKRTISFKGKKSEWVGKSPEQLNYDEYPELRRGEEIAPEISARKI